MHQSGDAKPINEDQIWSIAGKNYEQLKKLNFWLSANKKTVLFKQHTNFSF